MQNPRRLACLTLVRQEKDGYSNLVLASVLNGSDASARDKAFISALFYGTIERCITLDAILAQHLTKPLLKLDAEVRAVLRMGLYQALYMNSVPQSAAINESVKLVKQMGKTSASGFVNAVLRKACSFDISTIKYETDIQRLSVAYSVTQGIARVFVDTFAGDAQGELAATFERPRLCVRVNTLKTTVKVLKEQLEKKSIKCEEGFVPDSLYIDFSGDITSLPEFSDGLFHVQGEASQYACFALSPTKGARVLDLCAAPGGKAATIAQYMHNEGQLICADFSQNRLSLIETLFKRNGVSCAQIKQGNASEYCEDYENADYVLCDVPCSGLGIMSKKPDIRLKTLSELDSLIKTQLQILNTSAKYLKKGGRLVYSTCTINKDENEGVVNSFLLDNKDFTVVKPLTQLLPKNLQGDFTFFTPRKSKTDGFYVATLERL